jgi:hypothetical protein
VKNKKKREKEQEKKYQKSSHTPCEQKEEDSLVMLAAALHQHHSITPEASQCTHKYTDRQNQGERRNSILIITLVSLLVVASASVTASAWKTSMHQRNTHPRIASLFGLKAGSEHQQEEEAEEQLRPCCCLLAKSMIVVA